MAVLRVTFGNFCFGLQMEQDYFALGQTGSNLSGCIDISDMFTIGRPENRAIRVQQRKPEIIGRLGKA